MKKIVWLIICFFTVAVAGVDAQPVSVTANMNPVQIKIGQQSKISLQVTVNAGQKVTFPVFKDTIVNNVMLVNTARADTQKVDNGKLQITKNYTVTSFDSALYYIPPMVVKVDNKNYFTRSLSLKVNTVPVDTVHPDRFYGEKAIMKAPFAWADWIGMIIFSLLMLAFVAALIYLSIRLHDNKPIIRRIKIAPKLTPQQAAMKEIEEIKSEKLSTKQDNPKAYYTKLTETIRNYIKERFHFNAMEMTSQEIIDKLMELDDKEAIADLNLLFRTADLVKFAKHAPELNENDANLVKAIDFINQTKEAEAENKPPQPTEITVVEKRSLRAKRLLVTGIVVLSLAIAGSIIYIVIQLHELLSW